MAATEVAAGSSFGEHGRYHLEKVLGTGGMASVWLATDARLQRPVAIKILSDALALDADFVRRFEREARVAASLSHAHLVDVFDFSVQGLRPYLVMEYVAGGTLADRLRDQRGTWDPEVLFRELLEAVAYIHDAGIIHRDIKPANVLIGADGRARVTDFGIARPSAATGITNPGLVLGTARYVAPEVLRGQPADKRSDLYACGVLLRESLGDTGAAKLHRLADRLTAETPEMRPASATAVLEILDRPAAVAHRLARPRISRHGREIRVHLTHASAAAVAGIAALALILILLLTSGGGASSPPSRSAPPPTSAPLTQQLDALDQSIGRARK
jgi:eukaryotic-like serine/threonine-protein kinase